MTTGSGYVFDNAWIEARRRLRLLEEAADPATTRRLGALGVAPGWQCLEVGPGGGSIARWLCERVGPEGRVVAVDLDTRFVAHEPPVNLEIVERDIVVDGIPGGGYDLIHARVVLMHIPQRERLVADLIGCLRPGGWLLVEEADLHTMAMSESARYRQVWQALGEALATVGANATWGRMVPGALAASGLVDVDVEAEILWFTGGSSLAEFFSLSLEQARPLVVAHGTKPGVLDDALAEMTDPDRWFPGPTYLGAWGRRPD